MTKEKISVRVMDFGIKIFAVFGYHTSRSREYDFVMNNISSKFKGNRILDVGSAGSLLPLKLAKNGYNEYVIDVREYHEKHPNLIVVNTDIKKLIFQMIPLM
jgi:2-polyprenyl-3-methyl-5-hydroxy-6-metoxy-1,4-benzoquinol methylase